MNHLFHAYFQLGLAKAGLKAAKDMIETGRASEALRQIEITLSQLDTLDKREFPAIHEQREKETNSNGP